MGKNATGQLNFDQSARAHDRCAEPAITILGPNNRPDLFPQFDPQSEGCGEQLDFYEGTPFHFSGSRCLVGRLPEHMPGEHRSWAQHRNRSQFGPKGQDPRAAGQSVRRNRLTCQHLHATSGSSVFVKLPETLASGGAGTYAVCTPIDLTLDAPSAGVQCCVVTALRCTPNIS